MIVGDSRFFGKKGSLPHLTLAAARCPLLTRITIGVTKRAECYPD